MSAIALVRYGLIFERAIKTNAEGSKETKTVWAPETKPERDQNDAQNVVTKMLNAGVSCESGARRLVLHIKGKGENNVRGKMEIVGSTTRTARSQSRIRSTPKLLVSNVRKASKDYLSLKKEAVVYLGTLWGEIEGFRNHGLIRKKRPCFAVRTPDMKTRSQQEKTLHYDRKAQSCLEDRSPEKRK
jgi:hypothetical protein